jgi:exodeoxyribonuclease VII large subunit
MQNPNNLNNGVPVVTVSQVNRVVAAIIKGDKRLSYAAVKGEISNFVRHSASGHLYFTLKDENAQLKAVMFAGNAKSLKFEPKNGDKVVCRGAITVYEPSGVYQINCSDMMTDGAGEQAAALEELKKRLAEEGLFSQRRPLPKRPKKIAVITAPGGAALQDIINIISRRYPIAQLVVVPTLVQGTGAAQSLADSFERAQGSGADVIIFGRGGGSSEDLSAFNTETAVRAVYASKIPTISAVGHEIDTTLVDYTADLRAPTPSAAAELAVPNAADICADLDGFMEFSREYIGRCIAMKERELTAKSGIIKALSPQSRIAAWEQRLGGLEETVRLKMHSKLDGAERSLMRNAEVISALNPLGVLARGYAVAYSGDKVVTSADELECGDNISVRFAKGSVEATVVLTNKDF